MVLFFSFGIFSEILVFFEFDFLFVKYEDLIYFLFYKVVVIWLDIWE